MLTITLALLAAQAAPAAIAPEQPPVTMDAPRGWPLTEGAVTLRDFRFQTGETLAELRMHYTTLGTPERDADGNITNAVIALHGTGGSGKSFLRPQFADELFGPGQPLDTDEYFIVLPDNIGHGDSSKPSDGLRMAFPRYDYTDMIAAQQALFRELGIKQARLVMGTSMGCMHIFMSGAAYPGTARAYMPMACLPIEIAGQNRMWRQLLIDGIKADPAWNDGDYDAQPVLGLRTAASLLTIAGGAPLNLQREFPDREAAAAHARERVAATIASVDANDMIYQFDSSRTYDPWPKLDQIRTPTMWVNSADDFINPRNSDIPAQAVARNPNISFRLIPETADTHGHGTHSWAVNWRADLVDLLQRSGAAAD